MGATTTDLPMLERTRLQDKVCWRLAALLLGTAITGASVLAADPMAPSAKGQFSSSGVTLDAKSAVAFKDKSFLGGDDVLVVAVTNARINADALAEFHDRRRAVEKRIKDSDTGVVYFEFRPDGSFRGVSYYFGPGNGCGFCSSTVASSVKLVAGRITGTLTGTEASRPFDLALDVPLMSDDHGAALPADGGAPGATYLAYHRALVDRDRAALKPLLSQEGMQGWIVAEKKGDVDGYLRYLADEHPDKSVRIVKGYARDSSALLLVAGESAVGKLNGEVLLVKENGTWRVNDELADLERK
jgi:hypothetical protein